MWKNPLPVALRTSREAKELSFGEWQQSAFAFGGLSLCFTFTASQGAVGDVKPHRQDHFEADEDQNCGYAVLPEATLLWACHQISASITAYHGTRHLLPLLLHFKYWQLTVNMFIHVHWFDWVSTCESFAPCSPSRSTKASSRPILLGKWLTLTPWPWPFCVTPLGHDHSVWPLYVQKKHPKLERYRQVILNHSCRYSTFDPGGRECWCSNCWHVAAGRAMQTQKRTRSRKCHLPHRAVRSDPMEKMSVQQLCAPLVTLGFWDLHAVGRAAEASLDATESMAKTKSTPHKAMTTSLECPIHHVYPEIAPWDHAGYPVHPVPNELTLIFSFKVDHSFPVLNGPSDPAAVYNQLGRSWG